MESKKDECIPPTNEDKRIHEELMKAIPEIKGGKSKSKSRKNKGGGKAACHAICVAIMGVKLGMTAGAVFLYYGAAAEWLEGVMGHTCSKNPAVYAIENLGRMALFQESCQAAAERYQRNLNTLITSLGIGSVTITIATAKTYYTTLYGLVKEYTGCEGTSPKACQTEAETKQPSTAGKKRTQRRKRSNKNKK